MRFPHIGLRKGCQRFPLQTRGRDHLARRAETGYAQCADSARRKCRAGATRLRRARVLCRPGVRPL